MGQAHWTTQASEAWESAYAVDVCAGYTNPFILNSSFATGFTDPAVQWQNSIDSGKTWQNIAGANTTSYAIPRRDSGIVSYRILVAERSNINSPKCRITSNVISTNVHSKPKNNYVFQDFGKSFYESLLGAVESFKKYNEIHFIYPNFTNHPIETVTFFEKYCIDFQIKYKKF